MNKKQALKLIEGDFSPQDAKEVLLSLYSSKLNFHQMRDFSSKERFGKKDEIASKRIPEIKESMTVISAIVQEALNNNKKLTINAVVNIELTALK